MTTTTVKGTRTDWDKCQGGDGQRLGGVETGWYFWACSLVWVFRRKLSTLCGPRPSENTVLRGESGTVVPLPTGAAAAAGAGNASHSVIPKTVKFGGCSPPPKWEMCHRDGGFPDRQVLEDQPRAAFSGILPFEGRVRVARHWAGPPPQTVRWGLRRMLGAFVVKSRGISSAGVLAYALPRIEAIVAGVGPKT